MKEHTLAEREKKESFGGQITCSSDCGHKLLDGYDMHTNKMKKGYGMMAVCLLEVLFYTLCDFVGRSHHGCTQMYPDVSHHPLYHLGPPMEFLQ